MQLKFCGLTRPADIAAAAALGAGYVGVVLAGGPRQQDDAAARALFAPLAPGGPRRVAVFGVIAGAEAARRALAVGADVIQLHGDPAPSDIRTAQRETGVPVWAALRIRGACLGPTAEELFEVADAVVLDSRPVSGSALGGTGQSFEWAAIASDLAARAALRRRARLVVAGGLTGENVAEAIALLSPDVVDVSSGVEISPGIKDVELMRRFATVVLGAAPRNERPLWGGE